MTTKIQQVKDALKNGPLAYSEICKATGFDKTIVGVYLSTLQKRGEVARVGNRGSYLYSRRGDSGGEKAGVPVAKQEGVGSESGERAGLAGNLGAEETWPRACTTPQGSTDGAG